MNRGVFLSSLLFLVPAAEAHVRLDSPVQRGESDAQKAEPCGESGSVRGTKVATFRPGSQMTLRWTETIAHAGHYRIAFDKDGQDDFPEPTVTPGVVGGGILADGLFPTTDSNRNNAEYSHTITLPDVECDNCTLQLIQVMTDRAAPYYFRCNDLVLSADAPEMGDYGLESGGDGTGNGDGNGSGDGGGDVSNGTIEGGCSGSSPAAILSLMAIFLAMRRK